MQFGTYKPNEERARQAMLLIWIVMAIHVAAVVSAVMQLMLLHDFQNNIEISDEAFEQNDLREQILYFVYLAAFITQPLHLSGGSGAVITTSGFLPLPSIRTTRRYSHGLYPSSTCFALIRL